MFQKLIKNYFFASRKNHKGKRYYCYAVDTDPCGVDSLSKKGCKEMRYVFQLYVVNSRILKNIQEDRVT